MASEPTPQAPRVMVRMDQAMLDKLEKLGQAWASQRPASGSRFLHPNGSVRIATVIREVIANRLDGSER